MTDFFWGVNFESERDYDLLCKNTCPWCLHKLSPVFEQNEHTGDECIHCNDRFFVVGDKPND